MNFQTLNNAREKQYVQLAAVVVTSHGSPQTIQWKDGSISYETQCICTDGLGQQQEVWATSKFADPVFNAADVNQPMDWKMKWFKTRQGTKIAGYPLKPRIMGTPPSMAQPQTVMPPVQQPTYGPQPVMGQTFTQQAQQMENAIGAINPPAAQRPTMSQATDARTNSILWQVAFKGAVWSMGWQGEVGDPIAHMKILWREYYDILQKPGSLPAHDEDGEIPPFIANDPNVQYGQDHPISEQEPPI